MSGIRFNIFWLLLVSPLFFIFTSFNEAQDINEVAQTFKNSVQTNDALLLSDLLDNTVELTFASNHSTYTKKHTEIILSDFYRKYRPKTLKIDYCSNLSPIGVQYVIGTIESPKQRFKVYLFVINKDHKKVIQEIKITKI